MSANTVLGQELLKELGKKNPDTPHCLILIHSGADLTLKNWLGKNALHLIAEKKAETVDVEVLRMLAQHGMNLSAPLNKKQRTALHLAIENNNLSLAHALIDLGADPYARDNEYRSPLDMINIRMNKTGASTVNKPLYAEHSALLKKMSPTTQKDAVTTITAPAPIPAFKKKPFSPR